MEPVLFVGGVLSIFRAAWSLSMDRLANSALDLTILLKARDLPALHNQGNRLSSPITEVWRPSGRAAVGVSSSASPRQAELLPPMPCVYLWTNVL